MPPALIAWPGPIAMPAWPARSAALHGSEVGQPARCQAAGGARATRSLIAAAMLLLASILPLPCAAQRPAEVPTPPPRAEVAVGLELHALRGIDLLAGSFDAILILWARAERGTFDPVERLSIIHGRVNRARTLARVALAENQELVAALLEITVFQVFDSAQYPFDRHTLRIAFQAAEPSTRLTLIPDRAHSGLAAEFSGAGWRVEAPTLDAQVHLTPSSFGIADEAYRRFPRIVADVAIAREGGIRALGNFVGFAVAMIIAACSFAVPASYFGVRISLLGSGVFAAIGNRYLLNERLGNGPVSTLAEAASSAAFLSVALALAVAVADERLRAADRPTLALRLERGGLAVVVALGLAALLRVVWAATS